MVRPLQREQAPVVESYSKEKMSGACFGPGVVLIFLPLVCARTCYHKEGSMDCAIGRKGPRATRFRQA